MQHNSVQWLTKETFLKLLTCKDSGFESVAIAEFIRVTNCQNEDGAASCSKFDLFPEYTGLGTYF